MRFLRWISPAKPSDKWLYVSLLIICEPLIFAVLNNSISYYSLNFVFGLTVLGMFAFDFISNAVVQKKFQVCKSYSFWFLVAWIVWIIIGSFFTINKVVTLTGYFNGAYVKESVWQFCCYFLFFCAARKTQQSNRYYLTSIMVWLMCLYILLGFVDMYAFSVPGYISDGNKYALLFYHQNHSGYLATITTVLAFYKLCTNGNIKSRIPFLFAFVLHCAFLCLNGSLGPILAVVFAIALCFILQLCKKNWNVAKRVGCAICVLVLTFSFFDFVPKVKDLRAEKYPVYSKISGVFCGVLGVDYKYDEKTVQGSNGYDRIDMWKDCLKTVEERPLFGTGISTFEDKNPDYKLANPHNEFLEYAACCGIPTLIFYLPFAASLLVGLLKEKNKSIYFYNGCSYAAIGYFVSSFFGCTMGCIMPQLFLLLGFCDISCNNSGQENDNKKAAQS